MELIDLIGKIEEQGIDEGDIIELKVQDTIKKIPLNAVGYFYKLDTLGEAVYSKKKNKEGQNQFTFMGKKFHLWIYGEIYENLNDGFRLKSYNTKRIIDVRKV